MLTLTKGNLSAQRRVSEDTLMTVAQVWETFISDWLVGAVTRDASRFKYRLEDDANKSYDSTASTKEWKHFADFSVNVPKHPNVSAVRKSLDAKGQNISVKSKEGADKFAGRNLSNDYSKLLGAITEEDWLLLDLVRACRNAIAHRSPMSSSALNAALKAVAKSANADDAQLGNKASVGDIGTYLKSKKGSGQGRRGDYLITRVEEIGCRLKP